jgi:hypothetical protein
MGTPVFESASPTLVQGSGNTISPAKPSGTAEGDLLIEWIGVGSNVDQTPSDEFTAKINGPRQTSRPALMMAYHRADATEPSTYPIGVGASLSQNSAVVARFTGMSGALDPFGTTGQAGGAAITAIPSVSTDAAADEDDLALYMVALNSTRAMALPSGMVRITQDILSNIHVFCFPVPTDGILTVSGNSITGANAQIRAALATLKAGADAVALGSVIRDGAKVGLTADSRVKDGTKVPLTPYVIRDGAKVPVV